MSNYTKSTNFATKDALTSGNPLKIVKGTEINTEFDNIQTAIATKADLASPTFTGTPIVPTATAGTNNTQIANTAFVQVNGTPTGSLMMWATSSAPTNWLLCNGTAISRTTYATLFAIIGTTFGSGDGSTTFNVPDYRDRMPIGAGSTYSPNSNGGSASTTLSTVNLPSHTHAFTTGAMSANSTHSHTYDKVTSFNNAATGATPFLYATSSQATSTVDLSHTHSGTTDATGSATAFTNLPPYIGIYFIIKT